MVRLFGGAAQREQMRELDCGFTEPLIRGPFAGDTALGEAADVRHGTV